MQKITQAEWNGLSFKTKGKTSPLSNAVAELKKGEGLIIPRSEWGKNYSPTSFVYGLSKRNGFKLTLRTLVNDEGWAVMRVI